jgi:hypothetical protein
VLQVECSTAPMFDPRMSGAHQRRTLRYTPARIRCTPRIERRAGIRCGSPKAAYSVLRQGRLAVRRLRVGAGGRGTVPALGPGRAAHGPGACGATAPTVDFIKRREGAFRELSASRWDVIIIDEAHHLASGGADDDLATLLRGSSKKVQERRHAMSSPHEVDHLEQLRH